MSTSPQGFLDKLVGNFDVKCIVVGADYTFGKNAGGNVDMLKHYCEMHGIVLNIVPFETVCGEKLSTTYLKSLVKSGEVKKLNSHLAVPYFMSGVVQHARHKGTGMGFPTVNIAPDSLRLALKDGIYATFCNIDGKIYESMTNVGKNRRLTTTACPLKRIFSILTGMCTAKTSSFILSSAPVTLRNSIRLTI